MFIIINIIIIIKMNLNNLIICLDFLARVDCLLHTSNQCNHHHHHHHYELNIPGNQLGFPGRSSLHPSQIHSTNYIIVFMFIIINIIIIIKMNWNYLLFSLDFLARVACSLYSSNQCNHVHHHHHYELNLPDNQLEFPGRSSLRPLRFQSTRH